MNFRVPFYFYELNISVFVIIKYIEKGNGGNGSEMDLAVERDDCEVYKMFIKKWG